jgi:hypothetical protein
MILRFACLAAVHLMLPAFVKSTWMSKTLTPWYVYDVLVLGQPCIDEVHRHSKLAPQQDLPRPGDTENAKASHVIGHKLVVSRQNQCRKHTLQS